MGEKKEFHALIKDFNKMYGLPVSEKPTIPEIERLKHFKNILSEEVNEVDEIIEKYESAKKNGLSQEEQINILTELSDWLGDMVVYIRSEAAKYGINLEDTLQVIMQSNFSKLGVDGKPIYDERGKVLKGPNYWKPEPRIAELLNNQLKK